MKKDLTTEILNIIEKEVDPDSQDYIAMQLNELFASQNPERVIAYEFYCPSTGHCYVDYIHRSDIEAPGQEYMQRPLGYLSDLCFGSQEKEEYIDKSISIDEYMNMNPEIDPLEQNNKRNFPGAYMGDKTFNQPE